MYEDSGPAMNATAAADAAGGAGDESRFPESVLITWVPDDWTLTPGAVFAVAESAKFPFLNDGGERQPFGGLQIRIVALQCRCEELVGLRHEELRVLEERSALCIRGKDQLGVRKVLLQDIRVHRGHHDIVAAVHDQRWLTDIFQIVENALGWRDIFSGWLRAAPSPLPRSARDRDPCGHACVPERRDLRPGLKRTARSGSPGTCSSAGRRQPRRP